tara:strand:- start:31 stop:1053 length:1023 start_codon:yes stop_codon:yes gene_type:complete
MRKLLLTTTAIAGAMVLSAAHADVSITGSYEFSYVSQSHSTDADTTGASNDRFKSDQNVGIEFSNKTDSGLTIGMKADIESATDSATAAAGFDEAYLTISGGFGKIELGNQDGAGDQLSLSGSDLIGLDAINDGSATYIIPTGSTLKSMDADLMLDINDINSITYTLPKMGGLTLAASYADAGEGASANGDINTYGAKYEFESGAVKGSIHYGAGMVGGATAGAESTDSSSLGIKVSSGPITAILAQGKGDYSSSITTEVTQYGVEYAVGNGLTLSAVGSEVTENTGGETIDVTEVAAKYNIASGLDAYLTYIDYDYAAGTSGLTADDGSITALSLKATF